MNEKEGRPGGRTDDEDRWPSPTIRDAFAAKDAEIKELKAERDRLLKDVEFWRNGKNESLA